MNNVTIDALMSPLRRVLSTLNSLLDQVQKTARTGKPIPARLGAAPGTTDSSAMAYGEAYGKAREVINVTCAGLSLEELSYLPAVATSFGLVAQRNDVANVVLSAWDRSASAYMKGDLDAGNEFRSALEARIHELDAAILTQGVRPASPEK